MAGSIDKRLVAFFRSRSKPGARRRWRCPSEAEIAAYADHATIGREKEKIEAHLADCDFCLSQIAFLVRMEKTELPATVGGAPLSQARDLASARAGVALIPVWGRVAAAAACLAVAVTVSMRYSHFRTPSSGRNLAPSPVGMPSGAQPAPESPDVGGGEVRGGLKKFSLDLVFPTPGSAVARKDLRFRWKTVDGALDYGVRLLTTEGDLVWEQTTEGNSIKLPADVRVEMGRRYYLLIRADLPEGKTVESGPVAFSVTE